MGRLVALVAVIVGAYFYGGHRSELHFRTLIPHQKFAPSFPENIPPVAYAFKFLDDLIDRPTSTPAHPHLQYSSYHYPTQQHTPPGYGYGYNR